VVSFTVEPHGAFEFDGFYETPARKLEFKLKRHSYQFCFEKEQVKGVSDCGQIALWRPALQNLKRDLPRDLDPIDLGEFFETYVIR
jgi:hypothetical protein